jgi:oligoendopeptidase F
LILLNHTNTIRSLTTFAHELGHGINHELMFEDQEFLNANNGLFVAETASTFMEDFALDEVEKTLTTNTEKMAMIFERLDDAISTIFRQTACENLQREINTEFATAGFLSSTRLGELMTKHMQSYMGKSVEFGSGTQNWWVYWGHIRGYALYSYVSGLLMGKSIQAMYKKDPNTINKIRTWYGIGSMVSPTQSFADIGIDINDKQFWLNGLQQIDDLLIQAEQLSKEV